MSQTPEDEAKRTCTFTAWVLEALGNKASLETLNSVLLTIPLSYEAFGVDEDNGITPTVTPRLYNDSYIETEFEGTTGEFQSGWFLVSFSGVAYRSLAIGDTIRLVINTYSVAGTWPRPAVIILCGASSKGYTASSGNMTNAANSYTIDIVLTAAIEAGSNIKLLLEWQMNAGESTERVRYNIESCRAIIA